MPRLELLPTNRAPVKGALRVDFTKDDLDVARMVARLRHRSSRRKNRRPRFESNGATKEERDLQMRANAETGCLGEFAVSVVTGRRWVFNVGGCGGIDVEPCLEVKTRSLWHPQERISADLFRFQVWRKNVGEVLVGCLRPQYREPRPAIRGVGPIVASVWVCGFLPLTEDLYTNGAHQMIPGRALRPIQGLEEFLG